MSMNFLSLVSRKTLPVLMACGLLLPTATVKAQDEPQYTATISASHQPPEHQGRCYQPQLSGLAGRAGRAAARRHGGGRGHCHRLHPCGCLPAVCTLGGDNFWLIYNAKTGELKALNASGRSGEMATIDFYASKGLKKIPSRGYIAANTVPGVVSGWMRPMPTASRAWAAK